MAAGFVVLARRVLVSVDWTLLLVFMVMFIDVHLLIQLPVLQHVLHSVSGLSQPGLWLTAIGLSQVISNVPSTILLLNYVPPDSLLAWAVNIGGFGLLPGSLANLIALRMANDRRIWWRFHLWSIPCCSGLRRSVSDYSFSYSAQFVSFSWQTYSNVLVLVNGIV
ncbi:transporter, YbiR family [Enterobacter cloacae]|uniref:Transporter, YbiR family n=1 Tax=Enterobacter cloacae TaxID=550 RepID=A0A377M332_ENTCL|nr:transporter, YbiR family [Enterobacter cloacae]